jgi:hypothetical protein
MSILMHICQQFWNWLFNDAVRTSDLFLAFDGWYKLFQPIHTSGRQQESMTIPKAAHTVL